jgi:hypothetical protein
LKKALISLVASVRERDVSAFSVALREPAALSAAAPILFAIPAPFFRTGVPHEVLH